MNDLHLLHVIDSMGRGGAERQVAQLARYLASRGVRQSLVMLYRDDALVPELESVGVRCLRLGFPHRTASLAPLLPALLRSMRRLAPTVVSTQLVSSDILGRIAASICRVPVISTWQNVTYAPHAPMMRNPTSAMQMRLFRALDRRTAPLARRFIAVSKTVRDSYLEALHVPPDSTIVIPNSVDLSRFEPPIERDLADGVVRLVHVGRHVEQKGLSTLLSALSLLPEGLPFELHQYGAGPLGESLRAQATRLGLASRVFFHGAVPDVVPHLRRADVFVFPSVHEGLALALLEAYGAGLPVVASDIPPNREVDPEGQATLYAPPSDAPRLAAALRRIIEDAPLRGALGERTGLVLDPFRIERVGADFLRILQGAQPPARQAKR